ncbi:hypothetical protein COLO4_22889 [Corchorus olitorius]|uniref:Uncharacterized protein n=1 Tax=Corchorus olitorius TaxID=93759 RepID=A0A1R3IJD7_9ROSI|nr:hypothetical protein COLO4_22889 [Corchorus olitorius]
MVKVAKTANTGLIITVEGRHLPFLAGFLLHRADDATLSLNLRSASFNLPKTIDFSLSFSKPRRPDAPKIDALQAIIGGFSSGENHIVRSGISMNDLKSAVQDLNKL